MARYVYVYYRYYDANIETFGDAERAVRRLDQEFSHCEIDKNALNKVNRGHLVTATNHHKAEVEAYVLKHRLK